MNKKILVLPGDGIGPEVTHAAVRVLKAISKRFGHQFDLEEALIGAAAIDVCGDPFPPATLEKCLKADAILFGAIGHPKYDADPSATVRPEQGLLRMRQQLNLYANIRPVKQSEALIKTSPIKAEIVKGTDIVVFRELTGGIYFGEKKRSADGCFASDLCSYTREEITRIAHLAFKTAEKRKGILTLVDKANVLESSRLWRTVIKEMEACYPAVKVNYMYVDNAAMQLILNPRQFDVMLTENMFGDILTDEASVLCGSLGLLPSASVGDAVALYEPIHGSYPAAAGKDMANPVGAIASLAMLLEYSFGLTSEATCIREAIEKCFADGIVTQDLSSHFYVGTKEMTNHILEAIEVSTLEMA